MKPARLYDLRDLSIAKAVAEEALEAIGWLSKQHTVNLPAAQEAERRICNYKTALTVLTQGDRN